jgi:hypothetical protein
MSIVLRARCQILQPTYRIVRSQFDVVPGSEPFGEYVLMNLMSERGLLQDGKLYRITIDPFFPHAEGE